MKRVSPCWLVPPRLRFRSISLTCSICRASRNVLNAKHHEREAQIVAQAGRSGAVTIATNMAGRGTDILLGGNPVGYFDSILRKHAEHVDFIRDMPLQDDADREDKEEAIEQYIANMS